MAADPPFPGPTPAPEPVARRDAAALRLLVAVLAGIVVFVAVTEARKAGVPMPSGDTVRLGLLALLAVVALVLAVRRRRARA